MLAWLERFKAGVVAAAAAAALFAVVYLRGRRAGSLAERERRTARVNEQAEKARREVRDVQLETARKDDGAIAAELKRDWVRSPGKGGS